MLALAFLLIVPAEACYPEAPHFIGNVIQHIPSCFNPNNDINRYKPQVQPLPYYIQKGSNAKNPCRGKLGEQCVFKDSPEATQSSSVIGPLFQKFTLELQVFFIY